VTAQQSPFGLTLSYFYDAVGDRVRLQDSLGGTQVNSYDATGRLTSRTQLSSGRPGTRTDLTYTPDGQVATQTDTATAAEDLAGVGLSAGSATVAQNQNTSPTAFTDLTPVTAPDPPNLIDVQAADFNGDGLADVAAFDKSTGAWYVARSTGSGLGAFAEWTTPQTRWAAAVTWQVAAGDFTGDGQADLAALNPSTGSLYVAVSTGSGFAAQQYWQTWATTVTWVDLRAGNLSGHTDGRLDLAARALQRGTVWVSVGFDPTRDYSLNPDGQHPNNRSTMQQSINLSFYTSTHRMPE
jgi:YD repeat-containing protein